MEQNQQRKRWCKRGDTVSTIRPQSEESGPFAGLHLQAICDTPKSCAYANVLILKGRWRVSRCGTCDTEVEQCQCEKQLGMDGE